MRGGLVAPVAVGIEWVGAQASSRPFVLAVGMATFTGGFFAAALLNVYLLAIHHPLVEQFRSSLTYGSAIVGDGLVLPVVNMIAASYIIREREQATPGSVRLALLLGVAVTAAFHVDQAVHGIVNWAMPTPWHWNILGAWHAFYMLAVTSWLWLFLVVVIKTTRRDRSVPHAAPVVLLGVLIFFGLLRLDYVSLDLRMLLPGG